MFGIPFTPAALIGFDSQKISRRHISSRRPYRNTEVIRLVHQRCCARVPEKPTRARVITTTDSRRG